MLKYIAFIMAVWNFSSGFAQTGIDKRMQISPQKVACNSSLQETSFIYLPMEFGSAKITSVPDNLPPATEITSIQLWYSDFQLSEEFSQPALNRNRFDALEKIYPGITENSEITWEVLAQQITDGKNQARTCFHGFIIQVRTDKPVYSAEKEKEIFTFLITDTLSSKMTKEWRCDTLVKKKRKTVGYLPVSKKKRDAGITYTKKGIWNRRAIKETYYTTTYLCDSVSTYYPDSSTSEFFTRNIIDSTILTVFTRNDSWDRFSVTMDVTGSMSPYTVQLLWWCRLQFNSGKTDGFLFFNDGDTKPDARKSNGRTGGLYSVVPASVEEIDSTVMVTMLMGNGGGDIPENNIEALIRSQNEFYNSEFMVMIADNLAPVRDIDLLKQVTKPVRIILCAAGETGYIHPHYMEIAYKTNGSIHTGQLDITDLTPLTQKDGLKIGEYTYTLKRGKIVMTR